MVLIELKMVCILYCAWRVIFNAIAEDFALCMGWNAMLAMQLII